MSKRIHVNLFLIICLAGVARVACAMDELKNLQGEISSLEGRIEVYENDVKLLKPASFENSSQVVQVKKKQEDNRGYIRAADEIRAEDIAAALESFQSEDDVEGYSSMKDFALDCIHEAMQKNSGKSVEQALSEWKEQQKSLYQNEIDQLDNLLHKEQERFKGFQKKWEDAQANLENGRQELAKKKRREQELIQKEREIFLADTSATLKDHSTVSGIETDEEKQFVVEDEYSPSGKDSNLDIEVEHFKKSETGASIESNPQESHEKQSKFLYGEDIESLRDSQFSFLRKPVVFIPVALAVAVVGVACGHLAAKLIKSHDENDENSAEIKKNKKALKRMKALVVNNIDDEDFEDEMCKQLGKLSLLDTPNRNKLEKYLAKGNPDQQALLNFISNVFEPAIAQAEEDLVFDEC